MMAMETKAAIEIAEIAIEIAEEIMAAKEFFDKIGFEIIGTKDGNSENPAKIYCVRKKIKLKKKIN